MNDNSERKLDHIRSCTEKDVESREKNTGFEDIEFVHKAIPQLDFEDVRTETSFLGKKLDAPIMISPITGGHSISEEMNEVLASAAQARNLVFCVGSQRPGIDDPSLRDTYTVRDVANDILLFGNLGITQLNQNYGIEEVREAINMIGADGIGIHLNPLQEVTQPEGDAVFSNSYQEVSKIVDELEEFVYVKETGAGISGEIASKLENIGVDAIDVSGVGGTSWAGVETTREATRKKVGDVFWDWGLPTSVSTADVSTSVDIPVISSGGIRTGLDAAKAIALGADMISVGLPLCKASVEGVERVIDWIDEFVLELRVAMFLLGCEEISDLKDVSVMISGDTREWFKFRNIDLEKFEG